MKRREFCYKENWLYFKSYSQTSEYRFLISDKSEKYKQLVKMAQNKVRICHRKLKGTIEMIGVL